MIFAIVLLTLLSVPVFILQTLYLLSKKKHEQASEFFYNIAHALDIVGGVLLYKTKAKTVSAVTGKKSNDKKKKGIKISHIYVFELVINTIFRDSTHCFDAYIYEFECGKNAIDKQEIQHG